MGKEKSFNSCKVFKMCIILHQKAQFGPCSVHRDHVPIPVHTTRKLTRFPHTSTALVAPEVLDRTWNRRVSAGAVWPPSLEVPPL